MTQSSHSITYNAGRYIAQLFIDRLPQNLLFHNFNHTLHVIRGVKDIGKHINLSCSDQEILLLAAWFHDSGHIVKYIGHEIESQRLAKNWLESQDYPSDKTALVLACIGATTMPQNPIGLLQEVICDADLYHLSLEEYCHLQFQLKEEITLVFGKMYTDLSWMDENLVFIQNHRYFTGYGREVLEHRKQENYGRCQQLVLGRMSS